MTVVVNFRGGGPEELIEALPKNVDLALKKINYTETRNGIRRWSLIADSAAHSAAEAITRLEDIRMTFYNEQGLEDGTLTADRGKMNSESRQVQVEGNVVVTSAGGYVFYSEQLWFSDVDRLIYTDVPVRLVAEGMDVTGQGLRLDVQDHSFRLLSDVEARIAVKRLDR